MGLIDNILFNLSKERFIETLTSIFLATFAYLNYKILKEPYKPLVSANLQQIGKEPHLYFIMVNHSKTETEVLVKIKIKTKGGDFEIEDPYYGGKSIWILHPFMQKTGHFELRNLLNKERKSLNNFLGNDFSKPIYITLILKYRKRRNKWKETFPLDWVYHFTNNEFYPVNRKPKP